VGTPRPSRRDRLERAVNRAAAASPARLQALLAGRDVTSEGQRLSPQFALALRALALSGKTSYDRLGVPAARALLEKESWTFTGPRIEVGAVREVTLDEEGEVPVPARLYLPAQEPGGFDGPPPVVVFLHGGGWVLGSVDSHDAVTRFLCRHGRVAVLSVDYRLAPEHPFPAAVEDAVHAVRWARRHGQRWGFDGSRLAVAGDSAGGNLSAVACQQLRGTPAMPDLQVLVVPGVDFSRRTASRATYGNGFFLTDSEIDWYEGHYLGPDTDRRDPRASPLLADDLSGLPPAYVVVAGFDPLRDEGEAYARALRDAGVPVTLRRHTALVHPFVNGLTMSDEARAAGFEIVGAIRLGLRA
jgi:acetyl esterase